MATIDLGKIKFVFRGTYASGTAYVPDDVVTFTDGSVTSSYICTTATTGNNPSSGGTAHGSWAFLAKGQATSPTTTQGDIIVRGASADDRLAIGSAGQVLKVNSSANGLEYGGGGRTLQSKYARTNSVISSSNNYGGKHYPGNSAVGDGTQILSISITPISNTSHFQIWYSGDHACTGNQHFATMMFHGTSRIATTCGNAYSADAAGQIMSAWIDTTGLSGAQTIQVRNMGSNNGSAHYVNSDHVGNNKNTYAYLQVHEIED